MTWRNPITARRCDGKRAYRTVEYASKVAKGDSERSGDYIVAYFCYDCGLWHVGHADLTQKIIAEQEFDKLHPTVTVIPVGEDGRVCQNPECSNGVPEKGTVFCTKNCRKRARMLRKQEAEG
jgi:hypothetical protein